MPHDSKQDLLILGCSQRKQTFVGPAKEVYDGPLFRTLRRRSSDIRGPLAVLILSARHGVIRETEIISPYDEVVNRKAISKLAEEVAKQLPSLLPARLGRVLILAPKDYVQAIPFEAIRERATELQVLSDRTGKSQAKLLQWLGVDYERKHRGSCHLGPLAQHKTTPDPLRVQCAAAQIAGSGTYPSSGFQWYSRVGEDLVPAKRLVSALTDVALSGFETCHAVGLLTVYGIETFQVVRE